MKFVALVVIAEAEYEADFKRIAKSAGASGATIIEAKGSGVEEKKTFFSLTFEGNQSVILYILEEAMARKVLKALKVFIDDSDNKGLAFTTPILNIVGLDKTLLSQFEKNIEDEERL